MTELYPPAVGGSAVLLENVYRRVEAAVEVVTDPVTSPGPEGERGGLTVRHAPIRSDRWGLLDPRAFRRSVALASRVRRERGEVHCARAIPEGLAALLSRLAGGPAYAVWAHGEDVATALASRELSILQKAVYRGARAVLANSRNTARMVEGLGVPGGRITVVHPGVDAARFHPGVDGRRVRERYGLDGESVLLTVGRLQRRKGHDLVLSALARLDGVRWLVAGEGEERPRLERLAAELGVADRVVFAGTVPSEDLPAFYGACDVFVHPNRVDGRDVEGFGIVFLEAAACARPAIGGDSGGVPEAVADGETGLLVSGTDAEELARAIRLLVSRPDERQRLGRAGRARIETRFAWDQAARRAGSAGRRRGRLPSVLQVVLSLAPGGTERLVIEIARRVATEARAAVVCLDERGAWAGELEAAGIEVFTLARRPGFRPRLGLELADLATRWGADALHCHQFTPFVYGAFAARVRSRLRLVYTEHGRLSTDPASPRRRAAYRLFARLPGRFFAVSRDLASNLVADGWPARRLSVVHNGIAPGERPTAAARARARLALGLGASDFVVGTVARLDPVKDLGTLAAAFDAFRRTRPGTALAIVGDGPERARLEALAPWARFAGARDDARRLLPAFDVFANSSVTEGVSVTILEAMAAALPIVATRVGGTPEVVLDQETGLLVPARSPVALAGALAWIAADPGRARALGEAGRRRLETAFTLDRMAGRYLEAYFPRSRKKED